MSPKSNEPPGTLAQSHTASPLEQVMAQGAATKTSPISGFVAKLYRMLNEVSNDLISWTPSGLSFLVVHPDHFSRQVLPQYFKHNNFSSFVRQLNMYGFRKVLYNTTTGTESATPVISIASNWEFEHPFFQQGHPELLSEVKRRTVREDSSGSGDHIMEPGDKQTSFQSDLSAIRQQQAAIQGDIQAIQRDSQLLWTETLASRERHKQQQQVIDKILRFLASVFSGEKLTGSLSGALTDSRKPSSPLMPKRQRLLIEDRMDPDLRKQVFELMNRRPSPPAADGNRERVFDLVNTSADLGNDIELFEDRLDSLVGFDEPILPDPPAQPSSEGEFDISRYIRETPAPLD
jgi:hypothetical protein